MNEILAQLCRAPLFAQLTEADLDNLLTCFAPRQTAYTRHEMIWQEGMRTQSVGLVLNGAVHILRDDFWGNRSILAEVGPGDLFCEAYACLPAQPLTVSVQAAADCTVLFLDLGHTLTVCEKNCAFHQQLIRNLLGVVAEKNLMLARKIDHLSRRSIREKLLAYLSFQAQTHGAAEFTIPFNRQELADYLSVDRSALSQELSRMQREGLVAYQRSRFVLYAGGEHA